MATIGVGDNMIFRVISNKSHGKNTTSVLAPNSTPDGMLFSTAERQPHEILDFPSKLAQALAWQHVNSCPLVFFSRSFLFALVYAGYKMACGETDVKILCIKKSTASTARGKPVHFHLVKDLVAKFGIQVRKRKDGSPYQYQDELVATTSVFPGDGSCYVAFQDLVDNGLYQLWPALQAAHDRREPRFNFTIEDLRRYGFEHSWPLSRFQIETAARLSLTFVPCDRSIAPIVSTKTTVHLLTWFLSMQKRYCTDAALQEWIESHSDCFVARTSGSAMDMTANEATLEVAQYRDLYDVVRDVTYTKSQPPVPSAADIAAIERDLQKWHISWQRGRDDYRAKHPRERDYHFVKPHRDRQPLEPRPRSRYTVNHERRSRDRPRLIDRSLRRRSDGEYSQRHDNGRQKHHARRVSSFNMDLL